MIVETHIERAPWPWRWFKRDPWTAWVSIDLPHASSVEMSYHATRGQAELWLLNRQTVAANVMREMRAA